MATRQFLEKVLQERPMVEVATPSKVCVPPIYIFFVFMLMSRIDRIRSCFEDYILLFLFDLYIIYLKKEEITKLAPLPPSPADDTHFVAVRGLIHQEVSTKVRH